MSKKVVKNIERAVQQEIVYHIRKAKGEDVKIYDFIKPCGYSDVNEFYWDKQLFLLKHANYVDVEEPYISLNLTTEFFENKIPAFLWTINCPTTYAFVPNSFTDFKRLTDLGLEPVKIGYSADNGVIVSSDGDLRIFLIYPGDLEIRTDHFLTFFRDFLSDYFENVVVDNNDVLVNGKKVLGSVLMPFNKMGVFVSQISFSDKSDLIKKVCGEAAKVPGFIDPAVLSPYTLKDGFASWLGIS